MQLTLTPTPRIEMVEGRPCRVWEGTDEDGTPVHVWLAYVEPQTHDPDRRRAFAFALGKLPKPERQLAMLDLRFLS